MYLRLITIYLLFLFSTSLFAAIPEGYYTTLNGKQYATLIYSGAYPPTNSCRIKFAWAAIKSVIPADMHPFWDEKSEEKNFRYSICWFSESIFIRFRSICTHFGSEWIDYNELIEWIFVGRLLRITEHMHPPVPDFFICGFSIILCVKEKIHTWQEKQNEWAPSNN